MRKGYVVQHDLHWHRSHWRRTQGGKDKFREGHASYRTDVAEICNLHGRVFHLDGRFHPLVRRHFRHHA